MKRRKVVKEGSDGGKEVRERREVKEGRKEGSEGR